MYIYWGQMGTYVCNIYGVSVDDNTDDGDDDDNNTW